MKSFSQFCKDQQLQDTFVEVATAAVRLGWNKQTFVQNVLDHYSTSEQEKFLQLVTLVENSTGANWGSNIGSNIGGFIGGGLKGLTQGFRQGFSGQQQGTAQGQTQQQQVYDAEVVQPKLTPQQTSAVMELSQTIGAIQQKLQQVGLTGYANYLNNLMTAFKQATASHVDDMKRAANLT